MLKLNLGCGKEKYPDYVNIDIEESVAPDIVADFWNTLPYEDKAVDEILLIHTIEHIEDKYHFQMLMEFNRILKVGGVLVIAYPEFGVCANNYLSNLWGKREFWKRTLYGRQLYKSDYHVSLMDSAAFKILLEETGFVSIQMAPEPQPEQHNTIVRCRKSNIPVISKEQVLSRELFGLVA